MSREIGRQFAAEELLLGCAPCVMTNAPTIATGLKNNANSSNGLVYWAF